MVRIVMLMVVSLATAMAYSNVHAAPFLYEGFFAGGSAPLPDQYRTLPPSTTGQNNDSLIGQGPAGIGFSAGTNWVSGDTVSSAVYPRALSSGLTYSDMSGNTLVTQAGAADWHRGTGTNLSKGVTRDTNLTAPLPTTGYFSALVQFSGGNEGRFELETHNESGGLARRLIFGFNEAGNLFVGTRGDQNPNQNDTVVSSQVFTPGQTYLLFGEIVEGGVEDDLRLWVNPSDLLNPMADAPVLVSSDIGSGWVGGNAEYTLRKLGLVADTPPESQFIFDELRFGSSIEDVLPFVAAVAVPEPATWIMWMAVVGSALLVVRRRRK